MRHLLFLTPLLLLISCGDDDGFQPKQNEFGTQIELTGSNQVILNRVFVFLSITAQEEAFDFNQDGNASFDILAQFPDCARDDSYRFSGAAYQHIPINEECEAGISPLEGLDEYVLTTIEESQTRFQIIIRNSENLSERINLRDIEIFENEEGKRTIIGVWEQFPDFRFDVIMNEIDNPLIP